ncbi:glycosyltransferase [Synechococcus sp. RSCCF101]|uniref:HAD family hydrolase n=1 Tax=Synechococcus sp. RSCCF101 TaxID=2511069 RepID=UPI001244D05C|nr:HAD family hydrolase [Synechococcus sp. RSCCF101]QEY32589.1 glycosyltransferase [Synechococcus sp. RSCCF101]
MGLALLHLHLHGLFRSRDLELGRDADTGGQSLYVLELARNLAACPQVESVEVVTRAIHDRRVSPDYGRSEEDLAPGARIRRFAFGPRRYLRKELLWPHLDELADQLVDELVARPRLPDWVHAHYADAGYVGALVCRRLGLPLVFTAHSLGREKLRRLLATGIDHEQIDQTYAINRRIDAEELALAHAALVVTSTRQEASEQYGRYGRFRHDRSAVIPPGVDGRRFHPEPEAAETAGAETAAVEALLRPFLRRPDRPPLLALSRAVRRKNIPALVEAYGRSALLRRSHNLVLVLGSRDDLRQLERQQREVFQQLFELVDRFDLYGRVAYPRRHEGSHVPALYRWAAGLGGLFVNPALTEPFGLTLLEAAASGLPVVATDDGGPRDILERCRNGLLVDPTDLDALQETLELAVADRDRWQSWRRQGLAAVQATFSWQAHVRCYLERAAAAAGRQRGMGSRPPSLPPAAEADPGRAWAGLLLIDLDVVLRDSAPEDLQALAAWLDDLSRRGEDSWAIGLISGLSREDGTRRAAQLGLPEPRVWISEAGTVIHERDAGGAWRPDERWASRIARGWDRQEVVAALSQLSERLDWQEEAHQGPLKVSVTLRHPGPGALAMVRQKLRHCRVEARPQLYSHAFLDVVPMRASKLEASRHLALTHGVPLQRLVVVVAQQGDADLLTGAAPGVVVAGHDPSLEGLRGRRGVVFAPAGGAAGVLEGLRQLKVIRGRRLSPD